MTPGTSKAAMATVSIQMTAETKAGHTRGSSTFSRVLNLLTPWMLAASTSAGFMPRKAAEIITQARGVNVNPSTKPIPGKVAMFRGAFFKSKSRIKKVLMMPMRGCRRNTQPIAFKNVGKRIPLPSKLMASALCGKSVLSMNQAKTNPNGTETAMVTQADDGQRRDPRDSPEEKLGTVEAHGSGFERKQVIGCSHYPQSAYHSRRKAEPSIVLASRRTPHRV